MCQSVAMIINQIFKHQIQNNYSLEHLQSKRETAKKMKNDDSDSVKEKYVKFDRTLAYSITQALDSISVANQFHLQALWIE